MTTFKAAGDELRESFNELRTAFAMLIAPAGTGELMVKAAELEERWIALQCVTGSDFEAACRWVYERHAQYQQMYLAGDQTPPTVADIITYAIRTYSMTGELR